MAGVFAGSTGWSTPEQFNDLLHDSRINSNILWDIRLPRTLGAWLAGALLGLAGAVAQGVFRNPLADPYLLGSAAGALLAVAGLTLLAGLTGSAGMFALSTDSVSSNVFFDISPHLLHLQSHTARTLAAFAGAVAAVLLTITLARGAANPVRLLLAGVIVGMILAAVVSLLGVLQPSLLLTLQSFSLGTTNRIDGAGCVVLAIALVLCLIAALYLSPFLDALVLGEDTAQTLGLPVNRLRLGCVAVLSLATGAAVAQAGLIAFIGLLAPHIARRCLHSAHAAQLVLSAAIGGGLLLLADIVARVAMPPQELPVGVLTALLGGGYLLWLMRYKPAI